MTAMTATAMAPARGGRGSPPGADNALDGRLDLVASRSPAGRTFLSRQYHSVPFHVGKSYWDGRVLLAQVANPTAGIFAGDRMESRVAVETGASLALTTPSASRAHTMPGASTPALLEQSFRVASGAWLEVSPELFIPQRASSYRQRTEIEVAPGGSLYFIETLAPGRVAHGESLAYRQLDWSFSLRAADRLVAVERALIEPSDSCWMLDVAGWPHTYYASIWIAAPGIDGFPDEVIDSIEALADPASRLTGYSDLGDGLHAVKVLAVSSLALRRVLAEIRRLIRPSLPLLSTDLRKL